MRLVTSIVALLAVLLPGAAWAAAPPGASVNVKVPGYSPKTGDLLWELEAARLDPSPDDPKVLLGTDVRVSLYQEGKTHVLTAKKGSANTEKNCGTVEGNVVIVFDDEQATRVETDTLTWDGATGIVTTQDPVKITRTDLTADGIGLVVKLREKTGAKRPERADELTLERKVRVVVQPGTSSWLLSPEAGAKKPKEPGPASPAEKGEKAEAGPPKAGPEEQKEPILITSAGPLTIYRNAMTALFRDDVRAVQGPQSVTCDLLTIVFCRSQQAEKGGKEEDKPNHVVDTATAVGKVRVDDTRTIALADLAFWKRKETYGKPKEGTEGPAQEPAEPKAGAAKFPEGALKLVGQPAEVAWDNGNRLRAPIIYRLEDGSEFVCSPSEEHPTGVHLLAQTTQSGLTAPPKKNEPTPKPTPQR